MRPAAYLKEPAISIDPRSSIRLQLIDAQTDLSAWVFDPPTRDSMSLPDEREEFAVVADDSKELFQDTIAQRESNGSASLSEQGQDGESGQDPITPISHP